MPNVTLNPAERAAQEAQNRVLRCIEQRKSFLLEAGAGAGKTYSLIQTLKHLIEKEGKNLIRQHRQIACITFTNVACDEIKSRTDSHPAICASTIHAFCWQSIKDFQPFLRSTIPTLEPWIEKLAETEGVGQRRIDYELGHRRIEEERLLLHHDDVLSLTVALMGQAKFRRLFVNRYPFLLIDEYQDTAKNFASAIATHFLDNGEGPLVGFFGDHWQKIYGTGCGKIEHPGLENIGKESNFRSVPVIVECLNRIRPDLPQQVTDPTAEGSVAVYHTNDWKGKRRTGQHWAGDLPVAVAAERLEQLIVKLETEGWDFAPEKTKVLMLTHRVLAAKQGYGNLVNVFPYNEMFLKKEDPHIAFFVDVVEPVCTAYQEKRFGEMFATLGSRTPAIRAPRDKQGWATDMNTLLKLREAGTIGEVLDHLKRCPRPRLPDAVERKERELEQFGPDPQPDEPSHVTRLRTLKTIAYHEVTALASFIEGHTPFETKHGVKGAEFENVLVVIGRGWNHYNFNQFLEWAGSLDRLPTDKRDTYERNRNLFYVTCSRPKKRLAILFTQELTSAAMNTLIDWFGKDAIQ